MRDSTRFNELQRLLRDIEEEQQIMADMRSHVSKVAVDLGMAKSHSENWPSVVAYIKGWVKGYEKGLDF